MSAWDGFIEGAESMRPHVENAHLSQLSSQYNKLSANLSQWQAHVNALDEKVGVAYDIYTGLASVDRAMHCESASLEENAKAKIIKACALLCRKNLKRFEQIQQSEKRITIDMVRDYNLRSIFAFFIAHREILSAHNRALFSRFLMQSNGLTSEQLVQFSQASLREAIEPIMAVSSTLVSFNDSGALNKTDVYASDLSDALVANVTHDTLGYLSSMYPGKSLYEYPGQAWPSIWAMRAIANTFNYFSRVDGAVLGGFKGVYPIVDVGADSEASQFYLMQRGAPVADNNNFFQAVMSKMLIYIGSDGYAKMPDGANYRMLMKML